MYLSRLYFLACCILLLLAAAKDGHSKISGTYDTKSRGGGGAMAAEEAPSAAETVADEKECICSAGHYGLCGVKLTGEIGGCYRCPDDGWKTEGNGDLSTCRKPTLCTGAFSGTAGNCSCSEGYMGLAVQSLSTGKLSGCYPVLLSERQGEGAKLFLKARTEEHR